MANIVEKLINPMDPLAKYRSGSCEPWTVNIMKAIIACTKPRILLETGTYLGLTTVGLAAVMSEDAVLHTIDNMGSNGVIPTAVLENPQIKFHQADALQWIEDYDGPPFEFAFIDDCHFQEHVSKELLALKPKMATDSLICLHDVFGVFQLWDVVEAHGGFCLKLPMLHAAGGLGFIQL